MKPVATYQKLRGGYYTPRPIADFLANWAVQRPDTSVLEPSCGDGAILEAAAKKLMERGAPGSSINTLLQGIEFDSLEAQKATERLHAIDGLQQVQISTSQKIIELTRFT